MLPGLIGQRVSVADDRPCPPVPVAIRVGVPMVKAYRSIRRRLIGDAA
jgi:hypothetical protein